MPLSRADHINSFAFVQQYKAYQLIHFQQIVLKFNNRPIPVMVVFRQIHMYMYLDLKSMS